MSDDLSDFQKHELLEPPNPSVRWYLEAIVDVSHDPVARHRAQEAIDLIKISSPVVCKHEAASGIGELDDEWQCDNCGATWPKGPSISAEMRGWGTPPPPVRTHSIVPDPE